MEKINWNERMEKVMKYQPTTLKRMATRWLGKGWRTCNCWTSMETLKLAELCKKRLEWFEDDDVFMTWEYFMSNK